MNTNEDTKTATTGIPPHAGSLPIECILQKGGITGGMKMREDMMRGGGTKEEATSILTRKIAAEITIGNTIDNTTIEMSIEGITIERKIEDITQEGIETNLLTETSAQNNSTEVTRKDTTHRTNT